MLHHRSARQVAPGLQRKGSGGAGTIGAAPSAARCAPPKHRPVAPVQAGGVGRRALLAGTAALAAAASTSGALRAAAAPLEYEDDAGTGLRRLKYNPEGWAWWQWRGWRVHFIEAGAANTGTPVVLVHGYGASAYHWRYQIPALEAAGHRVYAVCLLGFGYSEKAVTEFSSGGLWADQLGDFIREVVMGGARGDGPGTAATGDNSAVAEAASEAAAAPPRPEPVVLAGNSLGGYASLVAAARYPGLVQGLMLLNSAGPLKDEAEDDPATDEGGAPAPAPAWWQPLADLGKRVVLRFAFERARQPQRIKEVLGMVYANESSIDDDLVESIRAPATDPNAAEVFYRINSSKSAAQPPTVNALFRRLRARQLPTLLLWGERDPWITSSRADRLQRLYPEATRVSLQAGHCPHDDAPAEASAAMIQWLARLKAA